MTEESRSLGVERGTGRFCDWRPVRLPSNPPWKELRCRPEVSKLKSGAPLLFGNGCRGSCAWPEMFMDCIAATGDVRPPEPTTFKGDDRSLGADASLVKAGEGLWLVAASALRASALSSPFPRYTPSICNGLFLPGRLMVREGFSGEAIGPAFSSSESAGRCALSRSGIGMLYCCSVNLSKPMSRKSSCECLRSLTTSASRALM